MLQEAISETEADDGFVDAALESTARAHQRNLDGFVAKPTYPNLDILARSLRALKWDISSILPSYKTGYERGGRKFMALAENTRDAVTVLPERITHIDGDRSAHGSIARFTSEIVADVIELCGPDIVELPRFQPSGLRPRSQSI